jgi:hypothetical protein
MVRREQLASLGGLDEATDMIAATDLALRALSAFDCVFVDRVVAQYRYDPHSLIHEPGNADRLRDAYRRMYRTYRARRGALRFFLLKAFDKSIKAWL